MCITYACFLSALLAFESGWDRDRYEAGTIQDWQLTKWAGGPVTTYYPQYSSWSQLTDEEWEAMAYRSTNALGFVGYQFGEALLIDLGYYKDSVYYGAGASTNTWDGTWTGKNGVDSLEEFKTKPAQTTAIQEAFGYNLNVLQGQLAVYGKSLDNYIGTTRSYSQNGETISVKVTLTGVLAASHLRGAWGTASLLLQDSVTADENGTSILQYVKQFGGYEAPAIANLIALYKGATISDTGLGSLLLPVHTGGEGEGAPDEEPGDDPDPVVVPEDDTSAIRCGDGPDKVLVAYAWGNFHHVRGFDPAKDRLDFGSLPAVEVEIQDTPEGLKITVKNNGGSGFLLEGVHAADLPVSSVTAASWNLDVTRPGGIADRLRRLGSPG
jgi:hypothetical protein